MKSNTWTTARTLPRSLSTGSYSAVGAFPTVGFTPFLDEVEGIAAMTGSHEPLAGRPLADYPSVALMGGVTAANPSRVLCRIRWNKTVGTPECDVKCIALNVLAERSEQNETRL